MGSALKSAPHIGFSLSKDKFGLWYDVLLPDGLVKILGSLFAMGQAAQSLQK